MELVNGGPIEMLSRRSIAIKDYDSEDEDDDESRDEEDGDRTSLKIDLSMAEQFYYEVISSFQKEEVGWVAWYCNTLREGCGFFL